MFSYVLKTSLSIFFFFCFYLAHTDVLLPKYCCLGSGISAKNQTTMPKLQKSKSYDIERILIFLEINE